MDCLILRFDAPLMSFGAVVVDHLHPIWRFPASSMLTGLLGNALGWEHAEVDRLDGLQARLRFAARWDAEPEPLTDYQTVDLGQDFLVDTGWTTRGRREDRKGGTAATGTHQRWRDHWANGVLTLALALDGDGRPTLDDIGSALRRPARPLFLGRKPCLPAAPLLVGRREAAGVRAALLAEPPCADEIVGRRRRPERVLALWPSDEGPQDLPSVPVDVREQDRFDLRDWRRNIHLGSRRYALGYLEEQP